LTIKTTRRSFLATAAPLAILAQEPHRAYDESKVRPYTLPDPLVFANGRKVASRPIGSAAASNCCACLRRMFTAAVQAR